MSDSNQPKPPTAAAIATAEADEAVDRGGGEAGGPQPSLPTPTPQSQSRDDDDDDDAKVADVIENDNENEATEPESSCRCRAQTQASTLTRACTERLLKCGIGDSVDVLATENTAATAAEAELSEGEAQCGFKSADDVNADDMTMKEGTASEAGRGAGDSIAEDRERQAGRCTGGALAAAAAARYRARRAERRSRDRLEQDDNSENGDDKKMKKQLLKELRYRGAAGEQQSAWSDENFGFCTFSNGRRDGADSANAEAEAAAAAVRDKKCFASGGETTSIHTNASRGMSTHGDAGTAAGRSESKQPGARSVGLPVNHTESSSTGASLQGSPTSPEPEPQSDTGASEPMRHPSPPPPQAQAPGVEHVRGRGPGRAPAWARRVVRRASRGVFSSSSFRGRRGAGASSSPSPRFSARMEEQRQGQVVVDTAELVPGEEVGAAASARNIEEGGAEDAHVVAAQPGLLALLRGGSVVLEGVAIEPDEEKGGVCRAFTKCFRRHRLRAAIVCAALAVVVAVILGVVLSQNRGSGSPEQSTYAQRLEDLARQVSGSEALTDASSSQSQALRQLLNESNAVNSEKDTDLLKQRYALMVLYFSTDGPSWKYQLGFLSGGDECDWREQTVNEHRLGVVCEKGQVVKLFLDENNLNGTVPGPEMEAFPVLKELSMSSNNLYGTFPVELTSISSLTKIALRENLLSGTMADSIGDLRYLEILDLDQNNMRGPIPNSIGNIKSLRTIRLSHNSFNSTIPLTWTTHHNLEHFIAWANNLTGSLPISSPSHLPSLSVLFLGDNRLTGTLPPALGGLSSLLALQLMRNRFHGPIPPSLSELSLRTLALAENELSGTVPSEIFTNGYSLRVVVLGGNNLTGTVPENAGIPRQLIALDLQSNVLSGGIPSSLGNHPTLSALILHSNAMNGTIPSSLGNSTQLEGLMLENNFFSGPVPDSFGNLKRLWWLSLARNDLSGNLNRVCAQEAPKSRIMTADCSEPDAEVHCGCCQLCCKDNSEKACKLHLDNYAFFKDCLAKLMDHSDGSFVDYDLSTCTL